MNKMTITKYIIEFNIPEDTNGVWDHWKGYNYLRKSRGDEGWYGPYMATKELDEACKFDSIEDVMNAIKKMVSKDVMILMDVDTHERCKSRPTQTHLFFGNSENPGKFDILKVYTEVSDVKSISEDYFEESYFNKLKGNV